MAVIDILHQVVSLLITLGILVTFHEFGHFWVARRCGVEVITFCIGFGPKVWSRKGRTGTEYAIAALPLGGYVKMLDEREGDVPEAKKPFAFNSKPLYQRMAIVAAGPAANLLLALFVYWLIFLPGQTFLKAEIFTIEPDSIAERAGIQIGQTIIAVDGEKVSGAQQVNMQLLDRLGDTGNIEITTDQGQFQLAIERWQSQQTGQVDLLGELGFGFYQPVIKPVIAKVMAGSAAQAAGIEVGDKLIAIDGEKISSWQVWADYVKARPNQTIILTIERDGLSRDISLMPKAIKQDGKMIGQAGVLATAEKVPDGLLVHQDYSIAEAFIKALGMTQTTVMFTLSSIKKLILGQLSYKQLSGPISIAKVASDSVQLGIISFLGTLALLSVSLGVLNLLPIPVLDGGHLLFDVIEVLKGSPVSEKVQMFALQFGIVVVLSLMVLGFVNDIGRL